MTSMTATRSSVAEVSALRVQPAVPVMVVAAVALEVSVGALRAAVASSRWLCGLCSRETHS
jgi:hypothetical protein